MEYRQLLVILTAANALFMYLTRNCLYIAIISMTNIKDQSRNSSTIAECSATNESSTSSNIPSHVAFDWSLVEVDMILGAYFYAYTAFQIPAGFLSVLLSPKHILNVCNIIHALITCLIPLATNYGPIFVMLSRFLMGVAGAFMFPTNAALVKKLALQKETTVAINLLVVFFGVGSLITPIITGYLCSKEEFGGWRSCFYVCGVIQLLYSILYIVISNSKKFNSIELSNISTKTEGGSKLQSLKLFCDWKVYAYAYSQFAVAIYMYLIVLKLPQYYSSILNMPIFQNGLINSLPMIVFTLAPLISSIAVTAILNTKIVSPRLLFCMVYTFCMSLALLLVTGLIRFINCDASLAVAIFCSAFFCALTANTTTFTIAANHSKYVSLSTSISNSIGNCGGFIVPIYANIFTKSDIYNRTNWHNVFYVTGIIGFSGVLPLNLMLWLGNHNPYLLKKESNVVAFKNGNVKSEEL